MTVLLPPGSQASVVYATPQYALELQQSGMTYAEIAYELNISVHQCKRWLKKAKAAKNTSRQKR